MGTYVAQMYADFFIPVENKLGALQAIRELMHNVNDPDSKASGGSWGAEAKTESWYSWVSTEDVLAAPTLEDALFAWRWSSETDDEGNIGHIHFEGEKLGDDSVLWKAIAPFVRSGSFIEMEEEDNSSCCWKWAFKDGEFRELAGTVTVEYED